MRGDGDVGILLRIVAAFFMTGDTVGIIILVEKRYFMGDTEASGWTSLFLSVWFLSGLIITMLGMVGIYVGRIFESVKHRPTYIVAEKLNGSDE